MERVSKVFPQLQVTVIDLYSGWIPLFMTAVDWRARKIPAMIHRVPADTGATYVDLFHLKPTDPFFAQAQQFFCPDGLHPSGEGYRVWFEELTRRVPLGERLGKLAGAD